MLVNLIDLDNIKKRMTRKSKTVENEVAASSSSAVESREPSDVEDLDDEFVVEKILQKRTRNGRIEYFLKWKGYTE